MTGPPYRIAHSLDLNFCSEFQSFPICHLRQHKLCLPNLARQRVAGVQTPALERQSVLALHRYPQYSGYTRDTVICETDDQPQTTAVFIAPDERRSHPIASSTIEPIEPRRRSLVVAQQILGANLVKVPQRPVIDAEVLSHERSCSRPEISLPSRRVNREAYREVPAREAPLPKA